MQHKDVEGGGGIAARILNIVIGDSSSPASPRSVNFHIKWIGNGMVSGAGRDLVAKTEIPDSVGNRIAVIRVVGSYTSRLPVMESAVDIDCFMH